MKAVRVDRPQPSSPPIARSFHEIAPMLSCRSRSDPADGCKLLPTASPSLITGRVLLMTTVVVLWSSPSVGIDVGMTPLLMLVLLVFSSADVSTALTAAAAAVVVTLLLLLLLLLLSLSTTKGESKDILECKGITC